MVMKNLRSDFSLERFARVYVREALSAAKENFDYDRFDYFVKNVVSTTMGIDNDQFRYLKDVFLLGLTTGENPYLLCFGPEAEGKVKLARQYKGHEVQKLASKILKVSRVALETRVRYLQSENVKK